MVPLRESVSKRLRACAAILVPLSLIGCASAGPSERSFINASSSDNPQFALVDITSENLDIVLGWNRPSLSAVFGDYRQPLTHKVDIGDTVQVNIWETGGSLYASTSPNISVDSRSSSIPNQVVAYNGTINVPYAGRFRVAGMTPQQIEEVIVARLQRKTANPQAIVSITQSVSQTATVTGDAIAGKQLQLSGKGDRVLDVIAFAGGINAPIHEAFVTISRKGKSLTVPFQTILSNTRENIYIRPADVVTVFRNPATFTAVGATGVNALIKFDAGNLSLEEAIAKAGGLLDERSDPKGVFVLRYESAAIAQHYGEVSSALLARGVVPVAYRLSLREPTSFFLARRFQMRNKDILYVSTAPLTEFQKVLKAVQSVASPVIQGAAISNAVN